MSTEFWMRLFFTIGFTVFANCVNESKEEEEEEEEEEEREGEREEK